MGKLTDRRIATVKAVSKDEFLSDGNGLYLRVRSSGGKTWLYRYKVGTLTRWLDVGIYPGISLLDARRDALHMKMLRDQGVDPAEYRKLEQAAKIAETEEEKQARAEENSSLTLSQLFSRWERTELKERKDAGAEVRRSFEKDVISAIGGIPVEDVTRGMIAAILDKVVERNAPIIARNLLGDLRQMFSFAIKRGLIEHDPTSHLKRNDYGKKVERERILSDSEINELQKNLPSAGLQPSTELALWLMLSTCCRVGELSRARWCDVDTDARIWHIPADNSKNGRAHTILLSDFSIQQFQALRKINGTSPWCYPAENKDDAHVCVKSITKQIHDRQRTHPMKNRSKATGALLLANGEWTPHDLRRTGATMMGTLGIRPEVIEKCLNHVERNKLIRVYQRQELKPEQSEAWRMLGEHLSLLLQVTATG